MTITWFEPKASSILFKPFTTKPPPHRKLLAYYYYFLIYYIDSAHTIQEFNFRIYCLDFYHHKLCLGKRKTQFREKISDLF